MMTESEETPSPTSNEQESRDHHEAVDVAEMEDKPEPSINSKERPARPQLTLDTDQISPSVGKSRFLESMNLDSPTESTVMDDDDDDMSEYDAETPQTKKLQGQHDQNFRVNGIIVDHEVVGGARPNWQYMYEVLFKSSTPSGQRIAVILLVFVSMSVVVAVLDSVEEIRFYIGDILLVLEILFTAFFSIEYLLRLVCLQRPLEFILSLLGFVDICALVPSYLGLLLPTARPLLHLAVLRIFRVMRVFRVLRMARFVDAAAALNDNIHANKRRIVVFLVGMFSLILVIGCAMYLIEGDRYEFSNIPISLYWTVVTITTVGYGDIFPLTVMGRILATIVMLAGYGIIACPLVLNQSAGIDALTDINECPRCYRRQHQEDANFCRVCGAALRQPQAKTIRMRRERVRMAKLRRMAQRTPSTARSTSHLLQDDFNSPRSDAPCDAKTA